jgi:hypothetical protein
MIAVWLPAGRAHRPAHSRRCRAPPPASRNPVHRRRRPTQRTHPAPVRARLPFGPLVHHGHGPGDRPRTGLPARPHRRGQPGRSAPGFPPAPQPRHRLRRQAQGLRDDARPCRPASAICPGGNGSAASCHGCVSYPTSTPSRDRVQHSRHATSLQRSHPSKIARKALVVTVAAACWPFPVGKRRSTVKAGTRGSRHVHDMTVGLGTAPLQTLATHPPTWATKCLAGVLRCDCRSRNRPRGR